MFLRVNPSGPLTQLIADMGVLLDRAITDNEFTTVRELARVRRSVDLVTLATDDAYGADSSTILVSETNGGTAYSTAAVIGILAAAGLDGVNKRLKLERLFNNAYDNHYTEFTYTGDNITKIEIWETSGKTVKLFTRDLTYTGDNLTGVTTTDERTSSTLTTTLAYSGDNLTDVTKVVA